MAKTRIDFGQDVLDLKRKKPTILVYGFKVYRLKPFIARYGKHEKEEGFDLYISGDMPRGVNEPKDHFEILASFEEIQKNKRYKLLKHFHIQTSDVAEGGLLLRAVIARYLMRQCGYQVENLFPSP